VNKQGVLDGVQFPTVTVAQGEQSETLRRLVWWFWHDLRHHFATPLARGHLWSAFGGLEDLRRTCVDLARLREDFTGNTTTYEKVEQTVPAERLEPLRASICPLEREAMLQAARVVVAYYEDLAPGLAQAHGVAYPTALARMMGARLEQLGVG
jgi:hypothetical protein